MGNKVFTFGDIRIREVKGKYYVYVIEKGQNRERRDNYVGSLEQIVKEYYNMKCRGRDLNPGHGLERAVLFSKKGFRNALRFPLYLFKLMEKSRDEKYDF